METRTGPGHLPENQMHVGVTSLHTCAPVHIKRARQGLSVRGIGTWSRRETEDGHLVIRIRGCSRGEGLQSEGRARVEERNSRKSRDRRWSSSSLLPTTAAPQPPATSRPLLICPSPAAASWFPASPLSRCCQPQSSFTGLSVSRLYTREPQASIALRFCLFRERSWLSTSPPPPNYQCSVE